MTEPLPCPDPLAPPDPSVEAQAALLEAMAHPIRLRLLQRLDAGQCCVAELVDETDALQPAVSRHLGVLREAGLVTCRAEGRRRCYRLTHPAWVRAVLDLLQAPDAPVPGGSP